MKVFITILGCICLLLLLIGLTELGILPDKFIAPNFLLSITFYIGIKLLRFRVDGDGGMGADDWGGLGDFGDDGDGGDD